MARLSNSKEYKKVLPNTRKYHLLRKYGITEEQYDELFLKQKGCCYICRRPSGSFKHKLCVDHNHKTGEIRGILCHFCNRRVIGRHTDGDLLIRAGEYLKQGTGLFVPKRKKRR